MSVDEFYGNYLVSTLIVVKRGDSDGGKNITVKIDM